MSGPFRERVRRAWKTAKSRKTETALRALSLAFGLATLLFACVILFYDIRASRAALTARYLISTISFWPRLVVRLPSFRVWGTVTLLTLIHSAQLRHTALYIGSVVFSIALAGYLNRSRLLWAVLSALFPYFAPTILAFRQSKPNQTEDTT